MRSKPLRSLWHWNGRASGLSGTSAAGCLWYSCGLCQFVFSASGAWALPRGWTHQDPFPASNENKVSQYLTLPHWTVIQCCPHSIVLSLCIPEHAQAVKIPLQWVLAQPSYFSDILNQTPLLSPDNPELDHGVTTCGPEDIQGQMCSSG